MVIVITDITLGFFYLVFDVSFELYIDLCVDKILALCSFYNNVSFLLNVL
jgi:hypothetical protein